MKKLSLSRILPGGVRHSPTWGLDRTVPSSRASWGMAGRMRAATVRSELFRERWYAESASGDGVRIGGCCLRLGCSRRRGPRNGCDAGHDWRSDDHSGVCRELSQVPCDVPRHGALLCGTGGAARFGGSPRAPAGLRRNVPDNSQLPVAALAAACGGLRCLRAPLRCLRPRLRGFYIRPADAALRPHLPGLRAKLPRYGEDAAVISGRLSKRLRSVSVSRVVRPLAAAPPEEWGVRTAYV